MVWQILSSFLEFNAIKNQTRLSNHKCAWPTLVSNGGVCVQGASHSDNIDLNPLIIVFVHSCLNMQLNWLMVGMARLWIISSFVFHCNLETNVNVERLAPLDISQREIINLHKYYKNIITLCRCWYMALEHSDKFFVEGRGINDLCSE
jgi:hypothetical protein